MGRRKANIAVCAMYLWPRFAWTRVMLHQYGVSEFQEQLMQEASALLCQRSCLIIIGLTV